MKMHNNKTNMITAINLFSKWFKGYEITSIEFYKISDNSKEITYLIYYLHNETGDVGSREITLGDRDWITTELVWLVNIYQK